MFRCSIAMSRADRPSLRRASTTSSPPSSPRAAIAHKTWRSASSLFRVVALCSDSMSCSLVLSSCDMPQGREWTCTPICMFARAGSTSLVLGMLLSLLCACIGQIPTEMGRLTALSALRLESNELTGALKHIICVCLSLCCLCERSDWCE